MQNSDITVTNWMVGWSPFKGFENEFKAELLDPVLIKHVDSIENFGYMTKDMKEYSFFLIHNDGLDSVMIGDLARLYEITRIDIYAVQPSQNLDGVFEVQWKE